MLSQDLDQLVALVPQYLHHGEFELTAGGSVAWYIDGREPLLNDAGVKIAGRILNHILLPETEVVAGPATAGIIVVSAVLQAADRKLLGCHVRDDNKGHCLQKQISGSSVYGRRVAIVDDTCSSGHSLLKCAEAVRQHGGEVIQVIALFDRDAGGNAVKAAGYRYDYALRVSRTAAAGHSQSNCVEPCSPPRRIWRRIDSVIPKLPMTTADTRAITHLGLTWRCQPATISPQPRLG